MAAVFPRPIQAAMLFGEDGQVQWLSPSSEELFINPPVKPGESLPAGNGYDPLIGLLKDVRSCGESRSAEITWPDGRTVTASLAPMEHGDCLALVYAAMQSNTETFAS